MNIETEGLFRLAQTNSGPRNYINTPLEDETESFHNFMVFVIDDFDQDRGFDWSNAQSLTYIKAQIDNSLAFGWKPEDIIIATNFEFEYNGVKTVIFENQSKFSQYFCKQEAVLELWNKGILHKNIWYHDVDAFQNEHFGFPKFDGDWAQCPYIDNNGNGTSWQGGVIFYKTTGLDILQYLVAVERTEKYGKCDELITYHHIQRNPDYNHRTAELNPTYNLGMTGLKTRYNIAHKPIKILHFHPTDPSQYARVVDGENELGITLVSDTLKQTLNKHFTVSFRDDHSQLYIKE